MATLRPEPESPIGDDTHAHAGWGVLFLNHQSFFARDAPVRSPSSALEVDMEGYQDYFPDSADMYIGDPTFEKGQHSLCSDLPCPILALTAFDLFLFQPSSDGTAQNHRPVRALYNALDNDFTMFLGLPVLWNHFCRRICMYASIPSLGVVVVATQAGRVGIVSLSNLPLAQSFAFKVDPYLPTAAQESGSARPEAHLHGIAVGPMQGTEDMPDDMKRWRLMLTYQDHTVLSYEIWRSLTDNTPREVNYINLRHVMI